jgi:Tol biopolymer transport system component/DNA-binding winged helix-turn-helix (wHTH) protein
MKNQNILAFLFDDIQVEPQTFQVLKAGAPVTLEPKTLKLLLFLLENRGRLIEKGEILDAVWKDTAVTENALTREVAKLRKSLGDDPKNARYISTVHTRGYRFIAEVQVKNALLHPAQEKTGNDRQEHPFLPQASTNGFPKESGEAPRPARVSPPDVETSFAGPTTVGKGFQHLVSRRIFGVAGALAILILVALFAWNYQVKPVVTVAPTVQEIAQITTAPELDLNPTFSPDGNSLAYSSDRSGKVEIYAKSLTPGGREIQLTADGNQNMEPAWSPDGEFIAYHSAKRGGIWLLPALGGVATQITEFGCRPAWSRDGSMLAFQSESFHDLIQPYASSATIWVVAARGGEPRQITRPGSPAGGHLIPNWSPDSRQIAFLNADIRSMQIYAVSLASGQLVQLTDGETGDKAEVMYSPDGESIFFTAGMILFKQRIASGTGERVDRPVKVADLGTTVFRHPTFSADGSKIAYSAWTLKSNLYSVPISPQTQEATGPAVALTNELTSRHSLMAFSPDGQKIVFSLMRRGVGYQLWMMDMDGKNLTQLTTDSQAAFAPSWYPSGDKIAFYCMRRGQSTISSLIVESRKESVLTEAEGLEAPRLSPDAKQVAFTYAPNNFFNIGIMNVEGGQPRQLTFETSFTGLPCWSPDGKFLACQTKSGDDMQILLIPSSSGTPVQLTSGSGENWPYSWSPDGSKIAFAASRDGVWNIKWISRSGDKEKQLTSNSKPGVIMRFPDWSPRGNQIVYEQAEIIGNIQVMSLKPK